MAKNLSHRKKSREALEVFQLYKGQGEYFDLAQLPPLSTELFFGGERIQENGYRMIPECIGARVAEVSPGELHQQYDPTKY